MKKKILIVLNLFFLFFLSFIIPKKKNLLLFGDGHKNFMGNSRYLFEYSIKYKHLKNYFIINNNSKYLEKKYTKNYIYENSIKTFWLILRAKYIFVNGVSGDVSFSHFLGRFNIINLWHGTPIKKIMFDDENCFLNKPKNIKNYFMKFFSIIECKNFKLFIAPNKLTQKHFESAFLNKKIKILGYPRNDYFFKDTKIEELETLKNLKISNFKKIILYAPTFRDHKNNFKPFSENFLKELNKYFKNKNFILLINKHPFTKKIIEKNFSNIIDISNKFEIQKVLKISDIYIGDYSSIYFDFGIQNKIMISYLYDLKEYNKKERSFYFKIEEEVPSFKSYNEKELLILIKKINLLEKDKLYKKNILNFNMKFNTIENGNSSKNILKYLKII